MDAKPVFICFGASDHFKLVELVFRGFGTDLGKPLNHVEINLGLGMVEY
jgi:hypothetical protein